ncbi:MAG: oligopeptide/dipeptide ABC transporter ATP-binding protein, partial [Nitrososphaerales archaeon]
IVVLYKGQILEKGAAEAVTLEPAHPYTLALQASAGLVAGHRTTTPERPTQAASRATGTEATLHLGCIFKNSCPWRADRCDIERPELRTVESVHVACHRAEEVRANTAINAPGGESARVPSRSS